MRKKASLLVLSLILLFSIVTPSAHAINDEFAVVDVLWGTPEAPIQAGPGDLNVPLTVIVQFKGDQAITGVKAVLHLKGPFKNKTGGNLAISYSSLRVQPGGVIPLTFTLDIDEDAPPGNYRMWMELTYIRVYPPTQTTTILPTGTTTQTVTRETYEEAGPINLNVTVPLRGKGEISISWSYGELTPFSSTKLLVTVRNVGEAPISSLSISAFPTGQISLRGSVKRYVHYLGPGRAAVLSPEVLAGPTPGVFPVKVVVLYKDPSGRLKNEEASIWVLVKPKVTEPRISVHVNSTTVVKPGEPFYVTFKLKNEGEEPAYAVSFTFSFTTPSISTLTPSTVSIGDLKPGEEVFIKYLAFVDGKCQAGVYPATFTVSFKDKIGTPKALTGGFSVVVQKRPKPVIDLYLKRVLVVKPGDLFNLTVNLGNVGEEKALNVKVELIKTPNIPITPLASTKRNVGVLPPSRSVSLRFPLMVNGDAPPNPYTLALKLTYEDDWGVSYVETYEVGLIVKSIIEVTLTNIELTPLTVKPGENLTLSADVLVTGTESARFVWVGVIEDEVFSGPSVYIGRVDPDVPSPFELAVKVKEGVKEGVYKLKVNITFYDEYNEVHQKTVKVPVKVVLPPTTKKTAVKRKSAWEEFLSILKRILGITPW